LTEKQRKAASLAGIVVFILFSIAVFYYVGRPPIRFVNAPDSFRTWVDSKGLWGSLAGLLICGVICKRRNK